MPYSSSLQEVVSKIRSYEPEIRKKGIKRLSIFGSLARDEATDSSDVDIMVDLDERHPPSLFTYLGIARELEGVIGMPVDLVVRSRLKELVRPNAESEAVRVF